MKFLLSRFNRGHAAFFGSSAVTQLFPLISAPIVARLYSPEDFGLYAVFYAMVSILGGIASLSLFNAALLESKGEHSYRATILGIWVALSFSLLLFAAVLLLPRAWVAAALGQAILPLLIWLPVTVFLTGAFQCVYSWAVKADLFQVLARNKLILAATTVILQISIGLTDPGPIGFVMANLLGTLLALVLLTMTFRTEQRRSGWHFSMRHGTALLKKHKNLMIWTTPASLVNYVSSFLPDLLINNLFGVATLGQYSLANRMINFPLTFVASSVQDIFRQQAAEEFDKTGSCRSSFVRFFWLLALACVLLILPLLLILPFAFPIIFGAQWDQAGYLIQSIAVLVIIRFLTSPLSYVWIIQGQQRLDLMWQMGLLAMVMGTFIVPPALLGSELSIYQALWVYGLGGAVWYLLCLIVSFRLSHSGKLTAVPFQPET